MQTQLIRKWDPVYMVPNGCCKTMNGNRCRKERIFQTGPRKNRSSSGNSLAFLPLLNKDNGRESCLWLILTGRPPVNRYFCTSFKAQRMRQFLTSIPVFLTFFSVQPFAQPLQFIDLSDSLASKAVTVAGDDFGAWFALVTREDSSLFMLQFDHCGEVEQSHRLELPAGARVSGAQVRHLGKRNYLIVARLQEGDASTILAFLTLNANIRSSQRIRVPGATWHDDPCLSVLDEDHILLGFRYGNTGSPLAGGVAMLGRDLQPRWTLRLADSSQLKWVQLLEDGDFVAGDGTGVRRYDTTGTNVWARNFPQQGMNEHSAISLDSLVVFATDYLDPVPDTGQVRRLRYKQVIALHENGNFQWESDRIRNLSTTDAFGSGNNHLLLDASRSLIYHGLDTLPGDSLPVVIAHKLDAGGRVRESVYFPADDTVREYHAALIDDGNVGICVALGNDSLPKGLLNVKSSKNLDVCDSSKFNALLRRFVTMDERDTLRAIAASMTATPLTFLAVEETVAFQRVCEKFDLKDGEIPAVLCKGDSVFLPGIRIPNARYEWSNGSTQQGTWVKVAGKYSVRIEYCGKSAVITYDVRYQSYPDLTLAVETCDYPYRLSVDQFPDAKYLWQNGDTTASIEVTGPGTYTVAVTKCEVTFQIKYTVQLPVFPNLNFNYNFCRYPDTIWALQNIGASYLWDDGSRDGARVVNVPGTYKVTISYCQSNFVYSYDIHLLEESTLEVADSCNAFPLPLAVVKPGGDEPVMWESGETTDTLWVTGPGLYSASVGSCIQNFRVIIVEENVLQFPNAFSPSSQVQENQRFQPFVREPGAISKYALAVYNRWGQKVFESDRLGEGWDGLFKGSQSPVETYLYHAIYERGSCGDSGKLKGSVSLIR